MRCCRTARRRIRTLTERSVHRYYGRCVRVQQLLQPRLRYTLPTRYAHTEHKKLKTI